jgi:serine protease Do
MNRWSFAFAGLLAGGLLGNHFVSPVLHGQPKQSPPPIPKELTSYRDVVKRILPAVVSLEIMAKQEAEALLSRDTVLAQEPGKTPKAGFGSGVLVDPRGAVLTSFHVVEGAQAVEVTLADGRKFVSRDIRGDKKTDVAVILLGAENAGQFPYLPLGDSDAMEIGDRVLAVGAPFGLSGSVTHGIISGKGRSGLNLNAYEDFLQTDAAINPGNSGGPLIALDGTVVGINAAIKSKNGGFQGVGLAVASNICKTVVAGLMNDGVVRRGYIGLQARDVTPTKGAQSKQMGALIDKVFDNTPAAKAGLKAGDIITAVAGRPVTDTKALQTIIVSLPLKQSVQMTVRRNGKSLAVQVMIEELPDQLGGMPMPQSAMLSRPSGSGFQSLQALAALQVRIGILTHKLAH